MLSKGNVTYFSPSGEDQSEKPTNFMPLELRVFVAEADLGLADEAFRTVLTLGEVKLVSGRWSGCRRIGRFRFWHASTTPRRLLRVSATRSGLNGRGRLTRHGRQRMESAERCFLVQVDRAPEYRWASGAPARSGKLPDDAGPGARLLYSEQLTLLHALYEQLNETGRAQMIEMLPKMWYREQAGAVVFHFLAGLKRFDVLLGMMTAKPGNRPKRADNPGAAA